MAVTIEDIIEVSGLTRNADGFQKTRGYKVTGITNVGVLGEAEAMTASGVPSFGDQLYLSTISSWLEVTSIVARIDQASPDVGVVEVTYQSLNRGGGDGTDPTQPDLPQISGSVSAREIRTNVDRLGQPITIQRDSGSRVEGGFVTIGKSEAAVTIRRREDFDFASNSRPGDRANLYTNKVNSTTWNGYGAGWWRCTRVDFSNDTTPESYIMTYHFQRALSDVLIAGTAKTLPWNPVAVYVRPEDNKPLPDPVVNVSIKEVDGYETLDFNTDFPI